MTDESTGQKRGCGRGMGGHHHLEPIAVHRHPRAAAAAAALGIDLGDDGGRVVDVRQRVGELLAVERDRHVVRREVEGAAGRRDVGGHARAAERRRAARSDARQGQEAIAIAAAAAAAYIIRGGGGAVGGVGDGDGGDVAGVREAAADVGAAGGVVRRDEYLRLPGRRSQRRVEHGDDGRLVGLEDVADGGELRGGEGRRWRGADGWL